MIRVGIDVRELGGRPTGVGRYLRELLVRWQADAACAQVDLVLFTPDPQLEAHWRPHGGGGATLTWQHVPGRGRTIWEQHDLARAARQARLDVFFAPAYTAPLRLDVPTVVVMHDVSFAAHPEWFPWRHGLRMRRLASWSARRARALITMSAFSAAEIECFIGIPAARVQVIPLAVDYHDSPAPAGRGAGPMLPSPPPTVLYVGSIFDRRHVPLLMQGVARARAHLRSLRLVVIGENRTSTRQDLAALADALGIRDAVGRHDYVTDDVLRAAYSDAGVFAFLSEYEGFGLTPLEAMRQGLPAIVLDTPVAREVYGEGAVYVRRGDADGVGRAIVDLLTNADYRAERIAAGDATVAGYRWKETARATWDVIRTVAEGRES